jgi:manganese oxidase
MKARLVRLPAHMCMIATLFAAQVASPAAPASAQAAARAALQPTLAEPEDYRRAGGRMVDGVLRVELEVHEADWQPWGTDGPRIRTNVYAVDGAPARTPGPLLRVSAGTPIHMTVTNSLGDELILRGLRDRGAIPANAPPFTALAVDSLAVASGATAELRFTPTEPGTFVWFGRTLAPGENAQQPTPLPVRSADRSLWGVLIVDPPDGPPAHHADERIFVITHWADPERPGTFLPATRFFVNGLSWPHTERLEYEQGDTIRWRVINVTGRPHPMHLHGAYFNVDAKGDQLRDVVYPEPQRRLAVTELVDITHTARLSWVADEPGNWLFHCHFMRHMSWLQTSPLDAAPDRHAHDDAADEMLMGGLVLGIHVAPRPGWALSEERPRRRLELHITTRPAVFDGEAAYGFVLADAQTPAADSVHFPGSLLLLERGQPTEISVRNRADVALGVHWHGLELESWADGVPGWSGPSGSVVPAVAPGDSLVVRITPPRAGTFMYHVHSEPGHQLAQGLYGPLLVLEPGRPWDPAKDRIFLLGSLGTGEDPQPAINGEYEPAPLELRAGSTYRLRFMHISPDDDKRVALLSGEQPVTWRFVAKDGADLPGEQVRTVPAQVRISVGETYDYEWTPVAGEYVLQVQTTFDQGAAAFPRGAPPPHTALVRITVRQE